MTISDEQLEKWTNTFGPSRIFRRIGMSNKIIGRLVAEVRRLKAHNKLQAETIKAERARRKQVQAHAIALEEKRLDARYECIDCGYPYPQHDSDCCHWLRWEEAQ